MKIIFEKIRWFYYPIIQYYLWRGYAVSVFDFDYDLMRWGWLRRLIHRGRLQRIYVSPMIIGDGDGIQQTDIIYARLKRKWFEKEMGQLYGSDEVNLVFKKWLAKEITQCLYIHEYLRRLESADEEKTVFFVPEKYLFYLPLIQRQGTLPLESLECVQKMRGYAALQLLWSQWRKVCYLFGLQGYLFLRMVLLMVGRCWTRSRRVPRVFPYGFAIHHVFDIAKNFDFIIDEKNIKKEDVLFLLYVPVKKDWLAAWQKKGYCFLNIRQRLGIRGHVRSHCDLFDILKVGKAVFKAPLLLNQLTPLFQAYLRCIRVYLDFLLIFQSHRVQNYIYRNQESGNQVAFNILLRREGGAAWDYAYSIGGGHLYVRDRTEFSQKQAVLFSFLNSDHYLGVSEDLVQYHKLHLQKVRHYHVIGNIYSGIVQELQDKKERVENAGVPGAGVVSFFDTSFIDDDHCVTTFDHAIYFYQDLLRLLEEAKNLFLIIKPSKEESYYVGLKTQWSSPKKGREIIDLWDRLRRNERVHWAGEKGNTPGIIANSDLVVTHAFSSPTAEALGAGKKAFWYQSQGRQPFLYRDIPGLVVHGYNALKERIDALLTMEEKDYKSYLNDHIKGRLDPFLDGLALKRFRQLIYEKH